MAEAEMTSRAVTQIPESKNAFRVWLEKILRAHYRDIKHIYNREIASDFVELVKSGNETNEVGNCKLIIDGDYLIMQAYDGSSWVATGWKIKLV